LVFKFFGEVCLNYMTSVKAGYLLKALTGKSKIIINYTQKNPVFSKNRVFEYLNFCYD
jgi:hypothetical protein